MDAADNQDAPVAALDEEELEKEEMRKDLETQFRSDFVLFQKDTEGYVHSSSKNAKKINSKCRKRYFANPMEHFWCTDHAKNT